MKVLLIAFSWPPSSDAGSQRFSRIARYLGEFGWEVSAVVADRPTKDHVFDRVPANVRVCGVPYVGVLDHLRVVKNALRPNPRPATRGNDRPSGRVSETHFLRELLTLPDEMIAWFPGAYREASRIVREQRVDVIISSSPPEVVHLVASRLSRRFGLPWIADLRDLWSLDHYRPFPAWKRPLLQVLEKRTLSHATALVTVSEGMADMESALLRRDVETITNGYDPMDWDDAPPALPQPHDGVLTLVYAGKLHPRHQSPQALFEGWKLALDRDSVLKIRADFCLTGHDRPDVATCAARCGLPDGSVRLLPPFPHRELPRRLRSYHGLMLFPWQGPRGDGWIPLKIFDYLAARRPILSIGGRVLESVERLLKATGLGTSLKSKEAVRDFLLTRRDRLVAAECPYDPRALESYSAREQAKRFSEVLMGAIKTRQ